jgi:hypothetical protein
MWGFIGLISRTLTGSVSAFGLIAVVAIFGLSETVNLLITERSVSAIAFLVMVAILLADLIAKFLAILGATFPDLVPKIDDDARKRASLITRLRPGQTIALMSGAYAARVVFFLVMFALLGASYAAAPAAVQASLFGAFSIPEAIDAFLREGVAGSLGYFLFFLGPEHLAPVTDAIINRPLVSSTLDGDILLVGIRIYGLAFVLAVLRTLVTPITFVRARRRARHAALAG